MKVKNNFVSIIALGNFNPAILSPDFLKDSCKFETTDEAKGKATPVVTAIEFGDTSFILELEKFQIMERNQSSIDFLRIMSVMVNYLDVLKFTPVHVMGLNINVDISEKDEALFDKLNDPRFVCKIFNSDTILYDKKMVFSSDGETPIRWEFTKGDDPVYKLSIDWLEDFFRVNLNVEKRDIIKARDQINYLSSHSEEIIIEFNSLITQIWN
nr:hypothetical protein [Desulfobulbaceae bacterium]